MSELRVVKDGDGSGYPKASLLLRAGARLVDVAIAWAIYSSTGPAGVVVAVLYILLNLEAYSLLIGSLMLFVALAAVMYVTRHLDWGARRGEEATLNNGPPPQVIA